MALWIRSYFVEDALGSATFKGDMLNGDYRERFSYSNGGGIIVVYSIQTFSYHRQHAGFNLSARGWQWMATRRPIEYPSMPYNQPYGFHWRGFMCGRFFSTYGNPQGDWSSHKHYGLIVPHGVVAALALLPSTPGLIRWRRQRRRRRRLAACLCPNCGYDVRATPDRCPECGTAPKRPRHLTP